MGPHQSRRRVWLLPLAMLVIAGTVRGFDVDDFISGGELQGPEDVQVWQATHPTTVLAWLGAEQSPAFIKEAAKKLDKGRFVWDNFF